MNLLVILTGAMRSRRALLATLAISSLLVVPCCNIPELRYAQPGPELPQTYQDVNNWFNRATTYDHGAVDGTRTAESSHDDGAQPKDSVYNSRRPMEMYRLVNFGKPTSPRELNGSDDVDDAPLGMVNAPPGLIVPPPVMSVATQTGELISRVASLPPPVMEALPPVLEDVPRGPADGPANIAVDNNRWDNSSHVSRFEFFNDPHLTRLIEQALNGNQELRILAEEIQVAANEVQARSGEYLPFVTFGAGAGVEKSGVFTRDGAVEEQLEIRPGQPFPDPLPDFLIATNVSWELDIWRKLRNARDAAGLRYLGTADGRNYILTRMVAEVAENYYELLALDNRLITLNQTIAIQEQSLETSQKMKEQARGTELAVQRFQAEVRKNQSERLIIAQEIVEAENRINYLLGRYPQPVERTSVEYIDLNLSAINAGIPAELLRNRSDILQAERELEAAGLDVQVARARFYPSLALNAGVGYRAFSPKYLFSTPESLIYNVAGDLMAPLINKKAIKAAYLSANAKELQSIYHYQRTVLNAYTEVINYLAKVENYRKSIEIKKQQLASLESSVDVATKLFQNARAEYVEVLLAQRDMMEAKMVLIETKQKQLSAVVNAYQALGGGRNFDDAYFSSLLPCE